MPQDVDLGDWPQIAPLFDQLEQRAPGINTAGEFQAWILDWGELSAALDEEGSRRNIAMTCHTDNLDAEKAHLHFVENIEPQLKPRQFALEKLYTAHPMRRQLAPQRFAVFDRDVKNHVELFRQESVPLETEDAKLSQQYQKLTGSLTVNFRGEEKTLPQMGRYLEETDRALRQEAWELVARRRLQEVDNLDDIIDRQIVLRGQIAKNAGFENYRDYTFRRMGRFDYTPEDCVKFHDAVEKEIVPIARELQARRREQLKLDSLRPWDLAVDPLSRPPLKPFEQTDEMVSRTQKIFNRLDSELAGGFQQMQDLKLLDLENRKGKAPGGYQANLSESRLPFIFMNAVGLQRDVETILHEAGHAFHALATRDEDLYAYRGAPMEFCEVASMSMELLGNEFIEEFYSSDDAKRARRVHLEGIVGAFPWIATVDAFQHWIYTHPNHTREERRKAWLGLMDRFGGDVDWNGLENARANSWHRQLHIFLYPFYYIEYGIAQLGALQVWANSKRDKARALNDYKKSLALGGSRPLPELFSAAGCQFEFSERTIQPLAGMMREELARL
ncbi:MAG TPA: M3 family oligoendopeptidase [Candidatus Sulfotelmatobacter sp.]|nr:M3 family oligoendopeptidase [Candidatus Sulfotelmatobacter sp.]